MNKNTTDITLSAYFNDIVIGYYEDEELVKQFGKQLGFDVDTDMFMAVSFLYPSDRNVTAQDREKLTQAAGAVIALSEINQKIGGKQIITCDSGVCVILITRDKVEMRKMLDAVKEAALQEVEKIATDSKVRVGIGTIEGGIRGIKHTYNNAQDAVKAGEIFKRDRVILEYVGMEIYSSINQMVVNFGDRLTRTVLKQLGDTEKRVLSKYYKCKEDIALTAANLGMTEDEIRNSLMQVKINTGLDVNDTEDNFKLHFITIAKKVLENDERIKRNR
ncbi:MAG: hypothetical protein HFG14_07530 [Lachnospiraceae bacterium]|jgi:sugar diacid utilization regulator|nr:hypothetical protein [Lachnospiraceae bacterium]NBJ81885.1 hypothetical protein [bacterium 1XD42-76]NBK04385.1 hypothetical protein [bacterium 1XD42-94]